MFKTQEGPQKKARPNPPTKAHLKWARGGPNL